MCVCVCVCVCARERDREREREREREGGREVKVGGGEEELKEEWKGSTKEMEEGYQSQVATVEDTPKLLNRTPFPTPSNHSCMHFNLSNE